MISALRVRYPAGRGILRNLIREATALAFVIDGVTTEALSRQRSIDGDAKAKQHIFEVKLHVHGKGSASCLAATLSELDGVDAVPAIDRDAVDE
jgi:putative Mg2+ transporter-C (MgtC) family protein